MRALFAKLMVPVSMVCMSVVSFAQDGGGDGDYGGQAAPEINPSLLVAGIVLLVGGTLVLLGRRRTRHAIENG